MEVDSLTQHVNQCLMCDRRSTLPYGGRQSDSACESMPHVTDAVPCHMEVDSLTQHVNQCLMCDRRGTVPYGGRQSDSACESMPHV